MKRWISGLAGMVIVWTLFGQLARADAEDSDNVALGARIRQAIVAAKQADRPDIASDFANWLELLKRGEVNAEEIEMLKSRLDEMPKLAQDGAQPASGSTPAPEIGTAHLDAAPVSNATDDEEFALTQMRAAIESTRKDDPELAELMEQELAAMQAEGELKSLASRKANAPGTAATAAEASVSGAIAAAGGQVAEAAPQPSTPDAGSAQ